MRICQQTLAFADARHTAEKGIVFAKACIHQSRCILENDDDVELTHQKQRDKPRGSKTPALSATQDPEGKYLRIQEHWSAVRPLTIADLTSAGKILPMDAVLLTEGDFVDVGAELDFVLSRQRNKGTTLKCFLTCTHIVRMIPAGYVEKMKLVSFR